MTDAEIEEGVRLCLENTRSLIDDARLLLKKGSVGHALFFILSAIEESSKAFMYAGRRVNVWKLGETDKEVVNHASKFALFISYLIAIAMEDVFEKRRLRIFHPQLPEKSLDIEDAIEMAQDLDDAWKKLWSDRVTALYVGRKNGKWTSPLQIQKENVESWLGFAERYLRDTEFQTRNILKAPKDVAMEFHSWLRNVMVPFAQNYLLENIDELHADKVISTRVYRKLKQMRETRRLT